MSERDWGRGGRSGAQSTGDCIRGSLQTQEEEGRKRQRIGAAERKTSAKCARCGRRAKRSASGTHRSGPSGCWFSGQSRGLPTGGRKASCDLKRAAVVFRA